MLVRGLGPACAALVLGVLLAGADDPAADSPAAQAARTFGAALLASDAAQLRSVLPAEGTIRVQLQRLGPAEGPYRASQFEALMRDFMRQGSVREFQLLGVDRAGSAYGAARARARLIDRLGRAVEIDLHLAFEPAGSRWALKEIRENPR